MTNNLEDKLHLSSRKRRIAAFMIDHFFMTFLIVSMTFASLGTDFIDSNNFSKLATTMLAVFLPVFFLYLSKDSIKGISLGKWIMGIMVRDDDNPKNVPSFGRLLLRNLLIFIWPVEFIVLVASTEKKRLGDKIAKTIVVRTPNKPSKTPRIIALIAIVIVFFAFIFLFVGSVIKNSDAYIVAVENIEQNQNIIDDTGGITGYGMMPTGSINVTNGYGEAQLEIKVLGNDKDVNVGAYLTKQPNGEWELINLSKE